MTKKILFWLMLALSVASTASMMTSCDDKKDEPKKEEPTDPTDTVPVIPIDTVPQTIAVTSISLDSISLTLIIGKDYTLTATVLPDNATDKTVDWQTSDATKATVANGKVIAIAAGSAIITAKAGDKTATCAVTIKEDPAITDAGVVINGIKWATRNIDEPGKFAATAESAGKLYQWNRKTAWSTEDETVENWDTTIPEGTEWTAANDPSPAGWRVPTEKEQSTLLDTEKVTKEWTTQNGVNGYKFTDKTTNNSLFLPAAGSRGYSGGSLSTAGSIGFYWSSTQYDSNDAYGLNFSSGLADWSSNSRSYGFSVRAVAE
jgi:uncharacterized protein (TIGR02145 family)